MPPGHHGPGTISAKTARSLFRKGRAFSGEVEGLLNEATNAWMHVLSSPDEAPRLLSEGWQVAPYDPNGLLTHFPGVKVIPGFELAAYQYVSGGNGNGFVFAIPKGHRLPPPPPNLTFAWDADGVIQMHLPPGFPDSVRPDLDSFLVCGGDTESYFACSLVLRELRELGALWHGADWSTHDLLLEVESVSDPVWTWSEPRPDCFLPEVQHTRDDARVIRFYTKTDYERSRVVRHTDIYRSGQRIQAQAEVIADGGMGYIF